LVGSARAAQVARRGAEYGVLVDTVEVDFAAVQQRQRQLVTSFREGVRKGLEQEGRIELIEGAARFAGPRTVEVEVENGRRRMTAPWIFLNTGTRAAVPPIDGLRDAPYLDNRSVMALDELPEHLVILGGGYIGLEFGQMFRRFGSRVTILQQDSQLILREDAHVAEAVAGFLQEEGIEILLGADTRSVREHGSKLRLEVDLPGGSRTVDGSHLLLAAGRDPGTEELDLEAAGIETDDAGYIRVDSKLRTSAEGIWALGDVKGGPAFTHISYDDFRIVRDNLLGGGGRSTRNRNSGDRLGGQGSVPFTLFTDPELGRVGLNQKQAKAEGIEFRLAKLPMTRCARALEAGETRGFWEVLIGPDDMLLGASILSFAGGEILSLLEVARMAGLPYQQLAEGVFPHPTFAESLNNLFGTLS
jgi:pyruvate/2-oxoglutarate dehydrogenase complex dihydrolipoamide dehydrogenase (E3) component